LNMREESYIEWEGGSANARLEKRCAFLLQLCRFALEKEDVDIFPCRDYLRDLYIEATGMEEYIDSCGAQKNRIWHSYREGVASVKMFSHVYYDLLHIQDATPYYSLLSVPGDFAGETRAALTVFRASIINSARTLLKRANSCLLMNGQTTSPVDNCYEEEFAVRLPADREVRHVDSPGQTVVYLATKFLNLAEEPDVREVLQQRAGGTYENLVPTRVNEELLRLVEARFHNLQSRYDTRISESDIEMQDRNLLVLRGHISIIYHLTEIATNLTHFYERHMYRHRKIEEERFQDPITAEDLFRILFEFILSYAARYLDSSVQLCREMIQSYAEEGTIEVPIPNYRGFHVRPSTLIAKIVAHYGSKVQMFLDGQEYDAGFSLDLFRANEAINAYKRRYIAEVISKGETEELSRQPLDEDYRRGLQKLFLALMNSNQIILYDRNISFDEIDLVEGETLGELASRLIKHYMANSKLDVHSDLTVTFKGDSRVLSDLKILAESGYGEDKFGNNIVLPAALRYLRP